MNIADLRKEYTQAKLDLEHVAADPLKQFEAWFQDALQAQILELTAMTLATVDAAGHPDARIVLLKGVSDGDFLFFTNYRSQKGRELEAHPHAALIFFWPQLERQIRIKGAVRVASAAESDEYYASRPLSARIGAWASPQSESISDRTVIERNVAAITEKYGDHPPRPPHWGGYRVTPQTLEFWQGRRDRLHDRILYCRDGDAWRIERLAP